MRRFFLGTLIGMVWVVLVLAAVSWLVVTLPRFGARARGSFGRVLERARSPRRSARSAPLSFRVEPSTSRQIPSERPVRGDGRRSRLVALVELILFVVVISALFAGAIAAAALRIGHLGA